MDGAKLVLAARLEEDRTGSAWADAARLGTGSYAGGSACNREEMRLGYAERAARLPTRTRFTRGEGWTRRGFSFGFGRADGGAAPGSFVGWSEARRIGFERRLRETAGRGAKRLPSARSGGAADGTPRIDAALRASADRLDRSDAARLSYSPDRSGAASAVPLRSKRRGGFRLGWRLRIRLQTRGGWLGFPSACRRAVDRLGACRSWRRAACGGGVRRRRAAARRVAAARVSLFFFFSSLGR